MIVKEAQLVLCVSAASQPPYNCGPVRIVFNVNIIIPFNSLTLTPGSTFNVCKGSGQIITAAAAGGGAATYILREVLMEQFHGLMFKRVHHQLMMFQQK